MADVFKNAKFPTDFTVSGIWIVSKAEQFANASEPMDSKSPRIVTDSNDLQPLNEQYPICLTPVPKVTDFRLLKFPTNSVSGIVSTLLITTSSNAVQSRKMMSFIRPSKAVTPFPMEMDFRPLQRINTPSPRYVTLSGMSQEVKPVWTNAYPSTLVTLSEMEMDSILAHL